MAHTMPELNGARHLLRSEDKPRMAKAGLDDLRKTEIWRELGTAIASVRAHEKLTLKEFAAALGRDERQIARWESGEERPQLETVFAIARFREPLVFALAAQTATLELDVVVRQRRRA
jgi:DNA-binding transcriptional regulator YiaG